MTKVVIDSFDTEEQAVAFVTWLKLKSDQAEMKILTTANGLEYVDYDGVDTQSSNEEQIVVNVATHSVYDNDDTIYE